MLHITFSKYDCIIVHKAYYLFTCTCVSINSFHSHGHSHRPQESILILLVRYHCNMIVCIHLFSIFLDLFYLLDTHR